MIIYKYNKSDKENTFTKLKQNFLLNIFDIFYNI